MMKKKIRIKVKASSKKTGVEKVGQNKYLIEVKEPAQMGRANEVVIITLAKYFQTSINDIKIVSGRTAPNKTVEINNNYDGNEKRKCS